jgi:hypothetical protein
MRRFVLAAIAVLAMSGFAYAQATPPQPTEPQTAPKAAKAPKAKHMTAVGKIAKADASSVTITTKKGEETFQLGTDAAVTEGTQKLTAADLSSKVGDNAKVTYTESGGTMTATKVVVSKAKAPAKAKEPKEPKTEPKK